MKKKKVISMWNRLSIDLNHMTIRRLTNLFARYEDTVCLQVPTEIQVQRVW